MRRLRLLLCSVVAVWTGTVAMHSQTDPNAAVVYEGARLIVGDGSTAIESSAFVVQSGLIKAVGAKGTVTAPAGSSRIDLTGKTVVPTFINVHAHPGYEGSPSNNYTVWNAENWTPQNVLVHLQREAFYGIGVVVSAGGDLTDRALNFSQDQVDGNLGPAARYVFAAGLELPNGGPDAMIAKANKALATLYKAANEQQARAAIQQIADKKIKNVTIWIDRQGQTYPAMTPESTAVYLAVYDEAHKHQMIVQTRARTLADQKAAVKGGTDVLVDTAGESVDDDFVALLKEKKPYFVPLNGTGVDPSESCKDPFVSQGVIEPALSATYSLSTAEAGTSGCAPSPVIAANEQKLADGTKKMIESGARLVLGTDAGLGRYMFGWSDHYVLARYVKFGLSPLQAIQAATQRPAELLGLTDTGTLAVGKRADFIVLNANPVEDIRNTRQIDRVFLRGVLLEREALLAEWSRTKARRR